LQTWGTAVAAELRPNSCECSLEILNRPGALWEYRVGGRQDTALQVQPPLFQIGGRNVPGLVKRFTAMPATTLQNGVVEQAFEGTLLNDAALKLVVRFRSTPRSPVVRFRYELKSDGPARRLTKASGADALTYLTVSAAQLTDVKEVRLSDYDQRMHATTLAEAPVPARLFENAKGVMGPILVMGGQGSTFLLAYEHGSQYPERFLEYQFNPDRLVSLNAVKGNYLHNQVVSAGAPYESLWLQVAGVNGSEDMLAPRYRDFVLRYQSTNVESRKPYIFYNTWGRQERVKWGGGKYLDSMNLETTLAEIDVAHKMGVEVFVIDTGWYEKTGDWEVSKQRFPDGLKQVKARLDRYGMKLGLWFNPTAAALSSRMLARNSKHLMSIGGRPHTPQPIWETEESPLLSLVSPYWRDFADELIRLNRELGVTYFKWDAVDQHGSDAAGHYHGTAENSARERADSYAFQLPIYLSKIADRLTSAAPEAIVDFDITEPGRAVGLQFLSSGKYFLINNGPYFHNFDLAAPWQSPLANGNSNIFVNPGPARTWFTRAALTYDKWIPSVLFLTHFQTDPPRSSQILNLASLILGQNGIWGEILKTPGADVQYVGEVIGKYKQVRADITAASPVSQGAPGSALEVHEKIGASSTKGAVVLFANTAGHYSYVTQNDVHRKAWHTGGPVALRRDERGRAVIDVNFSEPGARIFFFGAE
jgi:alpha-galactosidase